MILAPTTVNGKEHCAWRLHCATEPLACSGTLASAANICGKHQFAATKAVVHGRFPFALHMHKEHEPGARTLLSAQR
jgi:hypothetical protein